ncbi:S9 family peptidase [Shimazuella sp. AN120528]|uniref:S9 family peptidase n=1 Tax=Shimazuella soli TaxID=1892854 RepID=UPI001F102175|nr:S9 family peptidase [Shimazuella soli]MCH5584861.1 S9 family peptidase [Shimazuella soli]
MDRGIQSFLNVSTCHCPSFSPDGNQVAYLSNQTGTNQIWVMNVQDQSTKQITTLECAVKKVSYSPIEPILAFTMDKDGDEKYQIFLLNDQGEHQLLTDGESVNFFGGWSPDGNYILYSSNQRNPKYFDVYIQSIKNLKEKSMILESNEYWTPLQWNPNGKSILLMRRSEGSMNNDLFLFHLEQGDLEHLTPHKGQAYHWSWDFHGSGERLLVATDEKTDYAELIWLDLRSKTRTRIASFQDKGIDLCRISSNGKYLLYGIRKDGQSILRLIEIEKNREIPLPPLPLGYVWDATWANDKYLAITLDGAQNPTNLWILDIEHNIWITSYLPESAYVQPQLIHCPSFDGLNVPGWLYLPTNVKINKSLPVLIHVHGGPEDQARPIFNPVIQYFVSNGFAVLTPNIRGSTGYGKSYTKLDDGRKRLDAVADLHAYYQYLVRSKWINPLQVSIMGHSYGGLMVLLAMTTYPEIWANGVAIAPISDLESYLENTSIHRKRFREAEYGSLNLDRNWFREVSPIHHVEKITSPLLLIHGKNDTRIPYQETLTFFNKLKDVHSKVNCILLSDEGHEITKTKNKIHIYKEIVSFLK